MLQCRPIDRVTVFSKTPARAERFAESASKRYSIPVEAAQSCQEAVEDADIICTTTSAREPVLQGDWLAPGTHTHVYEKAKETGAGTTVEFGGHRLESD